METKGIQSPSKSQTWFLYKMGIYITLRSPNKERNMESPKKKTQKVVTILNSETKDG